MVSDGQSLVEVPLVTTQWRMTLSPLGAPAVPAVGADDSVDRVIDGRRAAAAVAVNVRTNATQIEPTAVKRPIA